MGQFSVKLPNADGSVLGGNQQRPFLIEFWAQFADREAILLVESPGAVATNTQFYPLIADVPVEVVRDSEIAASRIWISNWERMLPYVAASYQRLPKTLLNEIQRFVDRPIQLSRIERERTIGDPTSVRAAVFTLLHRGEIAAPKLRTDPLSLLTVFEPGKAL